MSTRSHNRKWDDDPEDWGFIEAEQLARVLAKRGDEAAIAELRALADAHPVGLNTAHGSLFVAGPAAKPLAELLAERGDEAAIAELRARADAGDSAAAEELARVLAERG